MTLGYKTLSDEELNSFINDIHSNIDESDNGHFERIIKYLVYIVDLQLQSPTESGLLTRLFDTVTFLLHKKSFLINLPINGELITHLRVEPSNKLNKVGDQLIYVLIQNQLNHIVGHMKGFQVVESIKQFIISIINVGVSYNDLIFRGQLKSYLFDKAEYFVDKNFKKAGPSESDMFNLTHIVSILLQVDKLMINSFNFEMMMKKLWLLLNNHSLAFESLEYLKSMILTDLSKSMKRSDVICSNKMNLLLSWIVSCLNSEMSTIVADSTHQCLGIVLEVSIKFDIVFNVRQLLNPITNEDLPLNILQILSEFKDPQQRKPIHLLDGFRFSSKLGTVELLQNKKRLHDYLMEITGSYKALSAKKQQNHQLYTFLTAMGNFPCLYSGDFDFGVDECTKCGSHVTQHNISSSRPSVNDTNTMKYFYNEIVLHLTKSDWLEDDLIAINYLVLLYKLLASFKPSNIEPIFQQLKIFVVSGNRNIRFLAVRVLPLLLIEEKEESVENQFKLIFQFLSSIQFDLIKYNHLAESTIMAYSELALISEGEWLNALVLRFVDLLGGNNEHHINLVVSSVLYVSKCRNIKPYKLLSPFLPVMSVKILKNEKILNKILEICGITKNYFLNWTKEYTTPHLLDYYQYDYLQDIASASNVSKEKLVTKCLPKILALHLVKNDKINDKLLVSVLKNAGYYKDQNVPDLYHNTGIGVLTWNILLQINYDDFGVLKNETRIYNALEHIWKMDNESTTRVSRATRIKRLLEVHNLEIIQKISQSIYQNSTSFFVKLQSIKAIEFLIEHNIEATSSVLSQISTSLQSLIEVAEFEFAAIKCLKLLIERLESSSLISLFDIIISLIYQRFAVFEPRTQKVAVDIIDRLFNHINEYDSSTSGGKGNYNLYYFSIAFIETGILHYTFAAMSKQVKKSMKPTLKIGYFPEFTRRLKTLNKFVVKQALKDLINYTSQYQETIQQEFKTHYDEFIPDLINTLLDTSYKFKNEPDDSIPISCAKCLSHIGSLDPHKYNLKLIKPKITLIHNFNDYGENSRLLTDFLENIIVVNFWASNNPIKQMYYSFAMQEILKVLKLSDNMKLENGKFKTRQDADKPITDVWDNFTKVTQSTLGPFLNSKFIFQGKFKNNTMKYPIFKVGMSHEVWVNLLAKDLIVNSKRTGSLFNAFFALISQTDLSISNYLLKYLILINLLHSDKKYFKNLVTEIDEIFNMDTSTLISADYIETLKSCYQTIFEILDYLNQWKSSNDEYTHDAHVQNSINESELMTIKSNIETINEFILKVSNHSLHEKSAFCGNYERTILYLETKFRTGEIDSDFIIDNLDQNFSLHSMYANINDLDSLDGVLKTFSTKNTNVQLKSFQYNENWSIAQEAFHVLSDNSDTNYKTKFLKSLNDHASYDEVLSNLSSSLSINNISKFPLDWSLIGVQASTYSGDLNQLAKWVYVTECVGVPQDVDNFIMFKLSQGLLMKHKDKTFDLDSCFSELYKVIGGSLNSSSIGTSRNLNLMMQLHMIYDIDQLFVGAPVSSRLENIDQSFETKWKMLSIHKFVNIMKNNSNEINQIHLECSKLARDYDKFHISIASIMKAMNYDYNSDTQKELELEHETNFEYGQLLWNQSKQTDAIKVIETINLNVIDNDKQKAKIQLQYADWLNESNHSSSDTIINEYTKAIELENRWEKPYFLLGKYYDKLLESNVHDDGYARQNIVNCFLQALTLGPSYIFEALPKLITIWLDFAQGKGKLLKGGAANLENIIQEIKKSWKSIPSYVWYTAITQMLSRIGHNHAQSVQILQEILSQILITYPQQGLWFTLSHTYSKDRARKDRVEDVLKKFTTQGKNNEKLLRDAQELFRYFVTISEHPLKKGTKRVSIRDDFRLTQLFGSFGLVIPTKANLDIKLPTHTHAKKGTPIFPKSSIITFEGVDDQVNVFHSLQMPKQIVVRGNDGKPYKLMLKKDDTRKDAKVVELTSLINRLLTSNNESRKRNMTISNYAVTPLSTKSGVIEFVSNVVTMKNVIGEEKKKAGLSIDERLVFNKLDRAQKVAKTAGNNDDGEAKAKVLKTFEMILEQSPPVLHRWFLNQFSDPTSWYLARNLYIRSSAVMSIVGYIIGLGDRHCENILFFKSNGGILHIDFDCLFEKGSTLPTPEIVPFRLTNNMIDAMGVNKVEGTFRKTCEVTETIMRANEHSLMNNLETLIYDPLLDWENHQDNQKHLRKVRRKLIGLLDEQEGLPMNVHGQVDLLIQVASGVENLCQMYAGWSPHI